MIARQTLNIYIQYLKNLPRLRGYSLVYNIRRHKSITLMPSDNIHTYMRDMY